MYIALIFLCSEFNSCFISFMKDRFKKNLCSLTEASDACEKQTVQSLWSGYGSIKRYVLENSPISSVIVKHIAMPQKGSHPRGWNTDLSHNRKVKSYRVETAWYKKWSSLCDEKCRVPRCFGVFSESDETFIVLEDLDISGFPIRNSSLDPAGVKICIKWLANFHGIFMGKKPEGLWNKGTYWHLQTRPDELEALDDEDLKKSASKIDALLMESPFQTFVHGDAKLANFCFSEDNTKAAAVDFQYVGGGCGMKDLTYFIGSSLYEDECEKYENDILESYFTELEKALLRHNPEVDFPALRENWQSLYHTAWADFHRFVKGWSPGHWKINSYSERITRKIIKEIN